MTAKKVRYIIFFLLILIVAYIVFDSTSQPSVKDLEGGFKEVAVYRNKNNTGPITRIYAATVQDTLWDEMKKYGDLMPYTKYGSTEVYFFKEGKPFPKTLQPGDSSFDPSFKPDCLGKYIKDANGQVSFSQMPFKP